MVFITSVDGKFIDVNQAGVEILGYQNKEELLKIFVKDTYFNPEDREKFIYEIASQGFAKDFETKLKRKDGTPIDTLITASVRKDEGSHVLGYEGIIKNISFRKRIEEELLQRTEEIQTLYDLSSLINQSLDLDRVIPLALERVLTLTGFEMGTIYLISDDGEWLELKYHQNYPSHLAEAVKRLTRGEGVGGSADDKKKIITFSIEQYPSPRILPNLIEEKVKTLVGIPLLSKGEAVGAICLTSRSDRILGQNDIHLFESLGNQIGMAIENARLFSSVAKAKSEWETTFDAVTDLISIYDKDYRILRANKYPVYDESGKVVAVVDMAREITEEKRMGIEKEVTNNVYKFLASSLDVRQVFKAVHSELKKLLDSERMTITLLNEEMGALRYFALEKDYDSQELMEAVTYPLKGTPSDKAVKTGLPIIVSDTEKENDYWINEKLLKEGIRSSLVFPLEYKGKIFGTLNFGSKAPHHFLPTQLNLLHQIVPGLAISIQNSLLLEEMKKSEESYRTVVEGVLEGIAVVGRDFKFKYVNNRLSEILGYTKEELEGMDFRNVLTEESRQFVADRYVKWVRKEEDSPHFEL